MKQPSKSRSWIVLSVIVLALVIDQVIKILVKTNMSLGESIPVFGDWFKIQFVENNGMAFGMEFLGKAFLTLFRVVAIVALGWYLNKLLKEAKHSLGYIVCIALILAGAAGNLIDCLYMARCSHQAMDRWPSLSPLATGTVHSCTEGWWICSISHSSPGPIGYHSWEGTSSLLRYLILPMPA